MANTKLTQHALEIWQAGVEAVTPARLFRDKVRLEGTCLVVEHVELELSGVRRLVVVGAGKAAAAMAVALKQEVLSQLQVALPALELQGWINAPADAFTAADAQALQPIHVHAARPAGVNSPTEAAIEGTQRIVELLKNCDARDRVICLLSGGGSALLVAPAPGVTLADKQAVAQHIAAAGGNIEQLNAVRRPLSLVKGGGLARACGAARMLTLIISDVLGDPLEAIASGPTILQPTSPREKHPGSRSRQTLDSRSRSHQTLDPRSRSRQTLDPHSRSRQTLDEPNDAHRLATSATDISPTDADTRTDAACALAVLRELGLINSPALAGAVQALQQQQSQSLPDQAPPVQSTARCEVDNIILGNNADAVDAAGVKAVELGYRYVMQSARGVEGDVLQIALHATDAIVQLASQQQQIDCWISGGEPTVKLPESAGQGGRNQQLTLAVMREYQSLSAGQARIGSPAEIVFLSGGTDGEDGPTDAAGALFDEGVMALAAELGLKADDYLARADAYSFFKQAGGLLQTGPTGTNVCDLRVALCKH